MKYHIMYCGNGDNTKVLTNDNTFEKMNGLENARLFDDSREWNEVAEELGQPIEGMAGWFSFEGQTICSNTVHSCRGCNTVSYDVDMQHDAHGIPTGHWCDACYNSSKYPYKKEKYYDYLDAGEYLDEDY